MIDPFDPWQEAASGAAMRRWNFDASALGAGRQGMYASWK